MHTSRPFYRTISHGWTQKLAGTGSVALTVNHHQCGQTGYFIGLLRYGHAFFDVFEAHRTGMLGNHRRVCIPCRQRFGRLSTASPCLCTSRWHRKALYGARARGRCRRESPLRKSGRSLRLSAFVVGHITHLAAEACRAVHLASTWLAAAAREAAPPMWKVRMVSCVPAYHGLRSNHAYCLTGIHQFAGAPSRGHNNGAQAIAGFTGDRRYVL